MSTYAESFKKEIARVARKELKAELDALRKTNITHRTEIVALRREARAMTVRLGKVERL
jgi:hypothetical protein